MTDATPLDTDHAAMEAAPEDNARQLRFYQRLAESELYLLLTDEPQGDDISPEIFDVADGRFVLAFDRADRLAQFAGRAVPYVALPGRVLAQMLAGQGVGLGLNLDVAPSAMLIPAEAVAWLNQIGAGASVVNASATSPDGTLLPLSLSTVSTCLSRGGTRGAGAGAAARSVPSVLLNWLSSRSAEGSKPRIDQTESGMCLKRRPTPRK